MNIYPLKLRLSNRAFAVLALVAATGLNGAGESQQPALSPGRDAIDDYERGLSPADRAEIEQRWTNASPASRAWIAEHLCWSPKQVGPIPLYDGGIPNSKPAPDAETHGQMMGMEVIRKVSHPTLTAYLPAAARASGTAVIIFPGGGYEALMWTYEGTLIAETLRDRGIAGILLKYRLPSDETMVDKSVGPLQDAQEALIQVRRQAKTWGIDPKKVGVMGFSAGGHLASTAGTHFDAAVVPNPHSLSVRPDFMILVYPLISMANNVHQGSLNALLGPNPSVEHIRRFSNELQVSAGTPPALLLAAENDSTVDIDHSIRFYEALRQKGVPSELVLFPQGQHGFFQLSRDQWMAPMWAWLAKNGWLKP